VPNALWSPPLSPEHAGDRLSRQAPSRRASPQGLATRQSLSHRVQNTQELDERRPVAAASVIESFLPEKSLEASDRSRLRLNELLRAFRSLTIAAPPHALAHTSSST